MLGKQLLLYFINLNCRRTCYFYNEPIHPPVIPSCYYVPVPILTYGAKLGTKCSCTYSHLWCYIGNEIGSYLTGFDKDQSAYSRWHSEANQTDVCSCQISLH